MKLVFNPLTGNFDFVETATGSYQPLDATLTSLSALGTAADKIAYTTGIDTWAETTITSAARALLADASVPRLSTANTWAGVQSIFSGATGNIPLTVKAFSGQTANLTEWKNSSGTVIASISASGIGYFQWLGVGIANTSGGIITNQNVKITSTGAAYSFVANIDSPVGNVGLLNTFNENSNLKWQFGYLASTFSATQSQFGTGGDFRIYDAVGDYVALVIRPTSRKVGIGTGNPLAKLHIYGSQDVIQQVIQANATQTANLTEWQTSGSTAKAYIASDFSAAFFAQTTTANAVKEVMRLRADVSTASTGASAGFGPALTWYGESSVDGTYRQLGQLDYTWATATDASRKARGTLWVYDTAAREAIRIEASGTEAMIGLYGVTAVARQTTSGTAATFVQNSGNAVNDASTFDGYTLPQVVMALRNIGVLT